MRKTRLTAGVSLAAIGFLAGSVGPALANDYSRAITGSYGTAVVGFWDDSIDTLCVRTYLPIAGQVNITPNDGSGPSFYARDANSSDSNRVCTGNLSIPEDELYKMTLRWEAPSGTVVKYVGTFYS